MTSRPDFVPPPPPEGRGRARPHAGRPASPARPKPPTPYADVLVGLLMVLLDCAVAMPFVLGVGFQDWGGAYGGGLRPAPPPMDWTPTIAFGVVTVLIAFSAAGFALARMPVSAFLQTVATLAMVLATIGVTGHEHDRAHPPPAPSASAPAAAPGAAVVPQRALLPLPGSALMPGSGAAGAPRALAPDTRPICAAAGGCR